MTIYVIAGNRNECDNWIKSNIDKRIKAGESASWNEYYYVSDVSRIKGISNPHGIFVGTWKDRDDIRDIVETLMIQSSSPNPALGKILKQLKHKKHDKINPYQHAADLLAKEIDKQVLDQMIGKKPTVFDIMEEYDQMRLAAPTTWKGFVK